ncbi:RNI-like protein [Hesseltinella vesiculosa]|uniref:RNI-like protein n=1 Tax=Hesseltinella vesiculosa TaxID=101127 RepID=A0A1X2GQI3_9FUNG|nr:RNI-like protein [Hesseltinella vesiculosa]
MADPVQRRKISQEREGSVKRHCSVVVNHLMEAGEKAYRDRNYDVANAHTTVALSLQPANLDILMRRVLLLQRLGMSNEALDEADAMMTLAPTDARGYLRAGQVLMVLEKPVEALRVFRTALEKVPTSDRRYGLLQIYRQRCLPQPPSFVNLLPYEVTRNIFALLPLTGLVPCTRVCRAWRQFIIHCPDLWRSIDLRDSPIQKRFPRNALAQCVDRSIDPNGTRANGLRELWVGNKMSMHDVVDVLVSKECKDLSVLYMSDSDLTGRVWLRMQLKQLCLNLEHLFLSHTDISIVDLMVTGETLPNLTQLVLDGCAFGYAFSKNIKPFDLSGAENVEPSQYTNKQALTQAPFAKLRILGLSSVNDMSIYALVWVLCRCPHLTMLRTLATRLKLTLVVLAMAQYCPDISCLEYSPLRDYTPLPFEPNQLRPLPNLHTLRCYSEHDDQVTNTILSQSHPSLQQMRMILNDSNLLFMSQLPFQQLTTLSILGKDISELALAALLKTLPGLAALDVSFNVEAVTDAVLNVVSATATKLHTLKLGGCVQITDQGLLTCASRLTSTLSRLEISGCRLSRKTISMLVLDLMVSGVLECPAEVMVKRKPATYPDMTLHQRAEFNNVINTVFTSISEDPIQAIYMLEEKQLAPSHPPTAVPVLPAFSSLEPEFPLTSQLQDIIRKDDLWSMYI